MQANSPNLRIRIVAADDADMRKARAARSFGVGGETVRRYVIQRRETGTLDPRPHQGCTNTLDLSPPRILGGNRSLAVANLYP
jgi:transposase